MMSPILVAGLINIETTLRIDGFPIPYSPVRYPFFGIGSTVSGVGYNVTKALTSLGDEVRFLSLTGRDAAGQLVRATLAAEGLPGAFVRDELDHTPQSVILYDAAGRRQINTDLKDIQERQYPSEVFDRALDGCALAALCNINFSRPFLERAHARGVLVATDVHAIASLDEPYNADYMRAADILFMSHELLPCPPEEWAHRVQARYDNQVIVVGMGADGALLSVRGASGVEHVPAVVVRPVVNTIGAGDALFSAFLHGYARTGDAHAALRRAVVFAAYKIGETGAAQGFLTEAQLEEVIRQTMVFQ